MIAFAVEQFGLPQNLKLSVHSGSDKFSIYAPIRRALARFDAGLHIKTAGTTWLEEVIGLAEAGGDGLALAKEIYAKAYEKREALCAPYAAVIDIDPPKLPSPDEVHGLDLGAVRRRPAPRPDEPAVQPEPPPAHPRRLQDRRADGRPLPADARRLRADDLAQRDREPLRAPPEAAVSGGRSDDRCLLSTTIFCCKQDRPAAVPRVRRAAADPRLSQPSAAAATSPRTDSFNNLFEIWLEGDHYKWRAMRANGVDGALLHGRRRPYEKFLAWAKTVPQTVRNPLYHWTHLELKRYFGINDLLNEKTAPEIWEEANAQLATPALTTQGILGKFRVVALCTTDDPADDLAAHEAIAQSGPDDPRLSRVPPRQGAGRQQCRSVQRLDRPAGGRQRHVDIGSLPDFLDALEPAARVLPRARAPPVRPRPVALLRRLPDRRRSRRDLRPGPVRAGGRRRATTPSSPPT